MRFDRYGTKVIFFEGQCSWNFAGECKDNGSVNFAWLTLYTRFNFGRSATNKMKGMDMRIFYFTIDSSLVSSPNSTPWCSSAPFWYAHGILWAVQKTPTSPSLLTHIAPVKQVLPKIFRVIGISNYTYVKNAWRMIRYLLKWNVS